MRRSSRGLKGELGSTSSRPLGMERAWALIERTMCSAGDRTDRTGSNSPHSPSRASLSASGYKQLKCSVDNVEGGAMGAMRRFESDI